MSAVIEIENGNLAAGGQRYIVWHDGQILIESAKNPMCEAARALSHLGVTGRLQLKRRGTASIDCEGLIAVLAPLSVSESQSSGPRFVRYSPHFAAGGEE